MAKIKDVLGTECEEQDTVEILNSLNEPVMVCKNNYDKYQKMFDQLDVGLSILDDVTELENLLASNSGDRLDRLYSHPILKDCDSLLP